MFGKNKTHQSDLELFTVYDSKSQSYREPVQAPNKDVLLREILNLFKNPSEARNILLTNAEDYSLWRIGTFDKKSGKIESSNPEHIANLHDLRALATPSAMSPNGPGALVAT